MRHQELKLLKAKLKDLGELHQDYEKEDDPDSRSMNMSMINDAVADIIDFVEKEIEDAVYDALLEQAKHD